MRIESVVHEASYYTDTEISHLRVQTHRRCSRARAEGRRRLTSAKGTLTGGWHLQIFPIFFLIIHQIPSSRRRVKGEQALTCFSITIRGHVYAARHTAYTVDFLAASCTRCMSPHARHRCNRPITGE